MFATASDIQIIENLRLDFYTNSQQIIETHYLIPLTQDNYGAPLPEKVKVLLKDGDIERTVHGGMHVGRAQFWAWIIYQKIREMFPEYTQRVFQELSRVIGLTEIQIITLIRYALLFHDTARLNEANELWDEASARNCTEFLIKKGLSAEIAVLFSKAAEFKDHPDEFAAFLRTQQIDDSQLASFHLIRKLTNLPDCLDIMRAVGFFQLSKVYKVFQDIPEYQAEKHQESVNQLAIQVYRMIEKQNDMLYPCVLVLPNGSVLWPVAPKAHFSLVSKVKFEHADNVCSAVGASLQEDPYFAAYLVQERFLDVQRSAVKPAFNPLIHGTNSFVLPMLKRSQFRLLASLEMLEYYGLAPICGEVDNALWGGGLDSLNPPKYICFGRLLSRGKGEYGIQRVVNEYTRHYLPNADDTVSTAKQYAQNGLKCGFENINVLLIHMARAKLLGVDAFSNEEYAKLRQEINGVIQLYYFMLLLGKYIHPNVELYQKTQSSLRNAVVDTPELRQEFQNHCEKLHKIFPDMTDTFEAFLERKKTASAANVDKLICHLTFQELVEKIMALNLDLQQIYDNPNDDNLTRALALLKLPNSPTATQFFSLQCSESQSGKDTYTMKQLDLCAQNRKSQGVEDLLLAFLQGSASADTAKNFARILLARIQILKHKLSVVEKVAEHHVDAVKFTAEEMALLKDPFPIIFLSHAEHKIRLCEFATQEYRAYTSLSLGEDITMMATDIREHQQYLQQFLSAHQVQNVEVVLIEELTARKTIEQQPRSPSAHVRLSLLAAKESHHVAELGGVSSAFAVKK